MSHKMTEDLKFDHEVKIYEVVSQLYSGQCHYKVGQKYGCGCSGYLDKDIAMNKFLARIQPIDREKNHYMVEATVPAGTWLWGNDYGYAKDHYIANSAEVTAVDLVDAKGIIPEDESVKVKNVIQEYLDTTMIDTITIIDLVTPSVLYSDSATYWRMNTQDVKEIKERVGDLEVINAEIFKERQLFIYIEESEEI